MDVVRNCLYCSFYGVITVSVSHLCLNIHIASWEWCIALLHHLALCLFQYTYAVNISWLMSGHHQLREWSIQTLLSFFVRKYLLIKCFIFILFFPLPFNLIIFSSPQRSPYHESFILFVQSLHPLTPPTSCHFFVSFIYCSSTVVSIFPHHSPHPSHPTSHPWSYSPLVVSMCPL